MANIFKSKYTGEQIERLLDSIPQITQPKLYKHTCTITTNNFNIETSFIDTNSTPVNMNTINNLPNKILYISNLLSGTISLSNCYIGIGIGSNEKALNIMYADTPTEPSIKHTYVSITNITDIVGEI